MDFDKTMSFKVERDSNLETKEIMKKVYQALVEKGYNPINQMVGYILSGDPTYITSHNDARNLIRKIERDELLEKMVKNYGDSRVGIAITDALGITAQGLETIHHKGNDKIVLRRLDEIMQQYEIDTIVVGKPLNMNGTATERVEVTNKFIHKLKCKYNKLKIDTMDERLTTVEAHRTMNDLNINPRKKKNLVDTISAVYILEMYMNRNK